MTAKTPKDKCLEMWIWLAKNPTKGKNQYRDYLHEQGRLDEYSHCWACEASKKYGIVDCALCPIAFPSPDGHTNCCTESSPYDQWAEAINQYRSKWAAEEMVKLIKTTWKEEN